jgi:hypothetical protein
MNTLRWALGIVLVLLGTGVTVLFVFADGFRRSFGASENNPLVLILPLASGALLLAALIFPGNRMLLHVAAVAAFVLAAGCVWQIIAEAATVLWFALGFLALWYVFYAMALRAPGVDGWGL